MTSHPLVTEACVVGIPDALKGQLPFALVTTSADVPDAQLLAEVQQLVRGQIGGIATLGGLIQGSRGVQMIPKTRSGKTLRRVVRDLLENAAAGEFDREVAVPSTIEDPAAVDVAREKIREYFAKRAGSHGHVGLKARL